MLLPNLIKVYWLNQGAQSFSIKECVVAIDIKSDTTWATSFQDRQVNILNGATLTVSVPMALDTVMMEEDAQVYLPLRKGSLRLGLFVSLHFCLLRDGRRLECHLPLP